MTDIGGVFESGGLAKLMPDKGGKVVTLAEPDILRPWQNVGLYTLGVAPHDLEKQLLRNIRAA